MNALTIDPRERPNLRFQIDTFVVRAAARRAFVTTMKRSVASVARQPGYRGQLVLEKVGSPTTLDVIVISMWESQEAFDDASPAMRAQSREIGVLEPGGGRRPTAFALVSEPTSSAHAVLDAHTAVIDLDENPNLQLRVASFFVPEAVRGPFEETTTRSRVTVEGRRGYRGSFVFERQSGPTSLQVVAIGIWESEDALEEASEALEQETGEGVSIRLSQLGVRVEIGNYRALRVPD